MVQGKLLMVHTGGVHGYGWSPGGGSFSRQGAEPASSGSPDLTRRRRRYRGEIAKEGLILGVSITGGKYRRRGHREGPRGSQEGAWRGPGWGRATCLVVALLPS